MSTGAEVERDICLQCRRLTAPVSVGAYRSSPDRSELALRRCTYCQGTQLAALRDPEVRLVVQELDRADALARGPAARRVLHRWTLALGAGGGLVLLIALLYGLTVAGGWGRQVHGAMAFAIAVLLGPVVMVAGRFVREQWRRSRLERLPARWALPGIPDRDGPEIASGTVEAVGPPIHAILTGRACVGYEAGVRMDGNGNGAIGTWLLLEQRCGPVRVGPIELDADAVVLRFRQRDRLPGDVDAGRLRAFLDARGFAASDELHVYETLLQDGAAAHVHGHGGQPVELRVG